MTRSLAHLNQKWSQCQHKVERYATFMQPSLDCYQFQTTSQTAYTFRTDLLLHLMSFCIIKRNYPQLVFRIINPVNDITIGIWQVLQYCIGFRLKTKVCRRCVVVTLNIRCSSKWSNKSDDCILTIVSHSQMRQQDKCFLHNR